MTNPYLLKLVAAIERVGNSARFQRLERETDEMVAQAKVKVDLLVADASAKSEQLAYAAHAARLAYFGRNTEWIPSEDDGIYVDADSTLESLQLTGVKVSISKSGKRGFKIAITTPDDRTVEITNTGSAKVSPETDLGYPMEISLPSSRSNS